MTDASQTSSQAEPTRWLVSLMEETGDREDWQPLASIIVDLPESRTIQSFEDEALPLLIEQLKQQAEPDEAQYVDEQEYYLWSTAVTASVTTAQNAATALAAQYEWDNTVADELALSLIRSDEVTRTREFNAARNKFVLELQERLQQN